MKKSWKKTHRQRVKYRERKFLKIYFVDFPKFLYLKLKENALQEGISINNYVRKIIREFLIQSKDKNNEV